MNIFYEIATDDGFCFEKLLTKLCCDILVMLDDHAGDSEKRILSKVEATCFCLEFCKDNKEKLKMVCNSSLKDFFCQIIKHYFTINHTSTTLLHSFSGIIVQCFTIYHESSEIFEFCIKVFLNYFTDYVQTISSHDVDENKLRYEDILINVKILFGYAEKFPCSVVVKLLNKIMEIISSHYNHCAYTLQWLSLTELLVTKTIENGNDLIHKEISKCIFSFLDMVNCTFGSIDDCSDNIQLAKYFDCLKHNNILEKIAVGINVLELIFSCIMNRNFCQDEGFSHILQSGQIWFLFIVGGFHDQTIIRKKTSRTLLNFISYIKERKTSCHISWSETFTFIFPQERFDNHMVLISLNNLEQNIMILLNYVQICELLEENQMHVVIPATTKIKSFLELCLFNKDKNPIWVLSIFLRMFSHEHK